MGRTLRSDQTAFRCNLVVVRDGVMVDYAGGNPSSDEGAAVVAALEAELAQANLLLAEADWRAEVRALAAETARQEAPVIFVTNEVGMGIVPENALARRFRDAAGWMNQAMAEACDEVWLAVAGYPTRVKPNEHTF